MEVLSWILHKVPCLGTSWSPLHGCFARSFSWVLCKALMGFHKGPFIEASWSPLLGSFLKPLYLGTPCYPLPCGFMKPLLWVLCLAPGVPKLGAWKSSFLACHRRSIYKNSFSKKLNEISRSTHKNHICQPLIGMKVGSIYKYFS